MNLTRFQQLYGYYLHMGRRIALFASGVTGQEVAKYLSGSEDDVVLLFIAGQNDETDKKIISIFPALNPNQIFIGDLRKNREFTGQAISQKDIDTIITVYWPFILPTEVFEDVEITVNFHPALLPMNRGWYPHVHNLIEGTPAGVTLHELAKGADTGSIWAQRFVETNSWDTASDLYSRLQQAILQLFIESWPDIRIGSITPESQEGKHFSYNSKNALDLIDQIYLQDLTTKGQFIDFLRARTFGEKGFAFFIDENESKIRVRIILEKSD